MKKITFMFSTILFLFIFVNTLSYGKIDSNDNYTFNALMDSCIIYQEKQDFQTTLQWALKAEVKAKEQFGEMDMNYVATLTKIYECYYYLGSAEKAIEYCEKTKQIIKELKGTENPEYARSVGNLGFLYNQIGNYESVGPLYKEALEIRRRLFKDDHPDLALSINNMGLFYVSMQNHAAAEPLLREALEMRKRLFQSDHPDLANSINNMAFLYDNMNNYSAAEPLYKEALEMYRRLFQGDHPDLANSISNMARCYFRRSNYSAAEPLYKEALEMRRRLYQGDHPTLALSISNMAIFFNSRGNYSAAEPLYKEDLEMCRRLYKNDHPDLANSINNMAYFYDSKGNYTAAEPLFKEALEMLRRLFNGDHPSLANSLNNMAYFFDCRGNDSAAEPLYKEALEMTRRLSKGDNPDLAMSMNNMAMFYFEKGDTSKAEPLFKEALEMLRRLYKNDHPDLAHSINSLANFYNGRGNYSAAEPLFKEALEMRRRLYKGDHPDLANSIKSLAYFYHDRDSFAETEPLYKEALNVYLNMLNNYFPSLSEKEKKQFWNTVSNDFEAFNTFAIERSKENPTILCNMYDIQLQTKSMLLNSSNRMKKRILNSGDSALIEKFKSWSDIRSLLVKLYKMSNDEQKKQNFRIDSIENAANDLEKDLSLKSEEFKQSYEKKKVTWRTIQGLLKPDEAAVEVLRFRLLKDRRFTDTIYYVFLIVTDQTEEHPELVLLENGNDLENDYYNYYRKLISLKTDDKESFKRYWGSLYEKLKDYKKIYFSADGIYNKLNPSTLLMPDGKYLLEKQEIQQINTTKDIIIGYYRTKEESNIYNNAVLIGNPNFSLSEEGVQMASRKMRSDYQEEKSYEQLMATRGIKLVRLPGTEKEVKEIEKFFKTKKWDVKTYLGDMAVKSAVKTAESPRVLHIATHGLFLEDVKRGGKEIFGFEEQKMVDNPLLRSGLFFSGADNYLKSESPGYIEEDNGLLTAYEAMNLNLDKTELVVLSACETGLGEIQNGEGVFGLRRAFQQAGARNVLMSLWKVDDAATQELMTNFYSNWVSGMSKREAFSKAQQTIKEKYRDPYYWGAFVMVGE
jgi:CHAT domain-containing protein/Tfp pilus assembly protein PilF